MPQQQINQKKKKKGPAPKHQNTFAFKHNPKSKTTAKILASPNIHVCRRCHDKIEWRKQYRKYKPRTQPGKCNGCEKRNVTSAYHTICESCTKTSEKAKVIIEEALAAMSEEEKEEHMNTLSMRACAICVKEIALPDPVEEEEDLVVSVDKIKLRERKTIERQLMKEANKKSATDGDEEDEDNRIANAEGGLATIEDDSEEEDDDPFLKAVGGADKLLTGEAYQKKLLEKLQQSNSESAVIGSS